MAARTHSRPNSFGIAQAKARLSEIVARAQTHGPQQITDHGRPAAVLVSAAEWARRTRQRGNLFEALRCPREPSDPEPNFEHLRDPMREVEF